MKRVQFVGLDVHADTIAVAVAEPGGTVRSVGVIPNRPESIRKLVKQLGSPERVRACYEAGPTGYVIYWQLTALGVRCEVVAPTLVPVKAGDRVKTDRRDALKLARSYRAGDLTPVWVPDAAHEALRDVVRAREAAKKDQLRARHRLGKFLLRHGRRPPTGINRWTQRHLLWVKGVRFAEAAQEATLLDYLHEVEHMADRLASPRGMGLDGFPHGALSAPEHRTDRAVAHVLSVQAQIPKQVKRLGHRAVPIRLRIGGAPLVTLRLRRGRQLSQVKLDRPRDQRRGKQPALFEMPRRDAIQRLPIVGIMPAGLNVVPQRLLGAMGAEFRLDGVPLGRNGGTPAGRSATSRTHATSSAPRSLPLRGRRPGPGSRTGQGGRSRAACTPAGISHTARPALRFSNAAFHAARRCASMALGRRLEPASPVIGCWGIEVSCLIQPRMARPPSPGTLCIALYCTRRICRTSPGELFDRLVGPGEASRRQRDPHGIAAGRVVVSSGGVTLV